MTRAEQPVQPETEAKPLDFIRQIIRDDLESGKHPSIVTRFPPEPNGYLHIGHAKSICLNFGVAQEFHGKCRLRLDDTNPGRESSEYVEAIKRDVEWLGFHWDGAVRFASDYFQAIYEYAVQLIRMGRAYVCDLNGEQIREYRGTLTEPGRNSPYRDRSVAENLSLFERMKQGEFPEGSCVLRAKIDMASPYIVLRDPVIYRILHKSHHRAGDAWHIYPMYDFAHCLSDMLEGVTHSLCTLEFENNRVLYDWVLDTLQTPHHPRQYEFARLDLGYTITSKRKLLQMVNEGRVSGWDDPRMPTLSGLRRRGYTPEAIRNFCAFIGIGKRDSQIDMGVLENAVREDLNQRALRVFGVLDPLKVIITNYPEGQLEEVLAQNHPQNPDLGARPLPFGRELYIERDDFMEHAPKKFFRLSIGHEVRLRYAYLITCTGAVKDENGRIVELRCTYDPASRGGNAPDGRKVKGTIHWVAAAQAVPAELRLYDRLFIKAEPDGDRERPFTDFLNPESLTLLSRCMLEPGLAKAQPADRFQFERQGYFCLDPDSRQDRLVFNRIVSLKDSWQKINAAPSPSQK